MCSHCGKCQPDVRLRIGGSLGVSFTDEDTDGAAAPTVSRPAPELPELAPRASSKAIPPPKPAGASALQLGSNPLEEWGESCGELPVLELAAPLERSSPPRTSSSPVSSGRRGEGARSSPVSDRGLPVSDSNPAHSAGARERLPPSSGSVSLANYGRRPSSLLGSIPYAIRVVLRRRRLRLQCEAIEVERAQAEMALEEQLVRLGEAVYAQAHAETSALPEVASLASALDSAARTRREREQGAARADADFRAHDDRIALEISSIDRELLKVRTHVDEQRPVNDVCGGASPQELESKRSALLRKRHDLEEMFARHATVRTEGVDTATRSVRRGLADLGRQMVSLESVPRTSGPTGKARRGLAVQSDPQVQRCLIATREIDAQLRRLDSDAELHQRAIAAADTAAVRRGALMIAVVAVACAAAYWTREDWIPKAAALFQMLTQGRSPASGSVP